MTLTDANLLIYAYNELASEHRAARNWLRMSLVGPEPIAFSWLAIMAFVRVATNKKIFTKPYSTNEAFDVVQNWLSAPGSLILSPGGEHLNIVKRLANESGVYGAMLTDAHIAALAIEHGITLATTDSDFSQFNGLKWINPLVSSKR
jgi:uncharacterized protein